MVKNTSSGMYVRNKRQKIIKALVMINVLINRALYICAVFDGYFILSQPLKHYDIIFREFSLYIRLGNKIKGDFEDEEIVKK